MKIALCLSGQPREVAETWRSWYENLLLQLPVFPDVFIHSSQEYKNVGQDFWDKLQPKAYVVEPQVDLFECCGLLLDIGYHNYRHVAAMSQQLYGLKLVWELKRRYEQLSGVHYDLVIRLRPDLFFSGR